MNSLTDREATALLGPEDGVRLAGVLPAGRPWPLGAQRDGAGLNLAVWAPDATALYLCLFDESGERELLRWRLPACTDGVWHGHLSLASDQPLVYGWRAEGPWDPAQGLRHNPAKLLLDPYARELVGRYEGELTLYQGHDRHDPRLQDTCDSAAVALKARVRAEGDGPPAAPPVPDQHRVAWADTVLCEVHVKGATRLHPQIPEALRGTYLGLSHPVMIEHWRRLGVTTLSLLPVHARADEARLQNLGLSNYWGYNTIGFFAPEPRYATRPERALDELRAMVDALHEAGLEVVLDVVYNHTAESDELGPTLSLRGLANRHYYCLPDNDRAHYVNWTGCGNCLNLSEPRVVQLVIDSLRYWVQEIGVDGFRFDLAPVLGRGADGRFDRRHSFFAAVQADPVLARVKLIAEPWDLGPGGYQLGGFPPGWAEWNDQVRDTLRRWWLRGAGDRGGFVHRFAASSAQFQHSGRAPTATVNFITAHDGFTLRDLVSYDHKHNLANGEINRDGHHHNNSWNCGSEGPTGDAQVLATRARLQRALLATLLLAQGTPMLLAGDEIGQSQHGNNNAYCQDNSVTWLDWAGADMALAGWVGGILALRRAHPALRMAHWLTGREDGRGRSDVRWRHPDGHEMSGADWSADRVDHALTIELWSASDHVLVLVNPNDADRVIVLPPGPWQREACSATGSLQAPGAVTGGVNCPARCLQVWVPAKTTTIRTV